MSDTALLEKPVLKFLPALKLEPDLPDLEAEFAKVAAEPFPVSFEVVFEPAAQWRTDELHVFMHSGNKRFQIDTVSASSLPLHDLKDECHSQDHKIREVEEAYDQAFQNLSVTFQKASEKPMQMAGWTVSGDESRFVMKHKGKTEVLRNIAYVTGTGARKLLGLDTEPVEGLKLAYLQDVKRAQMIFKY